MLLDACLIFIFSKGIIVFLLYFKVQKTKEVIGQQLIFLTSGVNKYFNYFNIF
jgi:hypothetical protein